MQAVKGTDLFGWLQCVRPGSLARAMLSWAELRNYVVYVGALRHQWAHCVRKPGMWCMQVRCCQGCCCAGTTLTWYGGAQKVGLVHCAAMKRTCTRSAYVSHRDTPGHSCLGSRVGRAVHLCCSRSLAWSGLTAFAVGSLGPWPDRSTLADRWANSPGRCAGQGVPSTGKPGQARLLRPARPQLIDSSNSADYVDRRSGRSGLCT